MTRAEERAYQRQNILHDMTRRNLNLTQYAEAYNAGRIDAQAGITRLSAATLHRWRRAYRDGGVESLAPRYSTPGGAGARTLTDEQKALIQSYYLHQNRHSLAQALRDIAAYHKVTIEYSTARRYIAGLPKAVHILKRQGAKAFNDKAAPYIRRSYDMDVMQIVSADHHILDFLCRHPAKGTPFRPWVTMIIDYRSRKPLGWHIGVTPNRYSILAALEQCVQTYGVPDEIHIDNGKDFKSKLLNGESVTIKNADRFDESQTIELQGVFGRLGVQVHFATPYRGQAKPVERFFRFVAESFSKQFPSYVGSNTTDRPADTALYYGRINGQEKRGDLLALDDVAALMSLWVKRYAAEHRHRGEGMDGRTPDQVFTAESSGPRPVMPPELRSLIFCEQFTRVMRRGGIEIEGTQYYAPELTAEYLGQQVVARRPFRDPQSIIVFAPDGRQLGTAYADYMADTGSPRENSRKRLEAQRAQKERLSAYLAPPVRRHTLIEELDEARKAVGADNDIVDISRYQPKKPKESKISDFFKGV